MLKQQKLVTEITDVEQHLKNWLLKSQMLTRTGYTDVETTPEELVSEITDVETAHEELVTEITDVEKTPEDLVTKITDVEMVTTPEELVTEITDVD